MEVKATLKTYRQSPRKVRLLAGEVVGMSVEEAKAMLNSAPKRVAPTLLKLITSAEANARDRKMDSESWKIRSLSVDQGPTLFRMRPRAYGRAFVIRKRTSHITVVLGSEDFEEQTENKEKKKEVKKEKTVKKPIEKKEKVEKRKIKKEKVKRS